jgi:IS1 family transposase
VQKDEFSLKIQNTEKRLQKLEMSSKEYRNDHVRTTKELDTKADTHNDLIRKIHNHLQEIDEKNSDVEDELTKFKRETKKISEKITSVEDASAPASMFF